MRKLILILTASAIFLLVNYTIWHREAITSNGRTILLELAPVDPRSLMQGDYMALRFKLENKAFPDDKLKELKDGCIVLALDSNNIGTFRRFVDGWSLNVDEALLRYRIRKGQPKFATNAFFFEERQGNLYEDAKYGEFKVSPNGEAILIALRDAKLQTLGQQTSEQVINTSSDKNHIRRENSKDMKAEDTRSDMPPVRTIIVSPDL